MPVTLLHGSYGEQSECMYCGKLRSEWINDEPCTGNPSSQWLLERADRLEIAEHTLRSLGFAYKGGSVWTPIEGGK